MVSGEWCQWNLLSDSNEFYISMTDNLHITLITLNESTRSLQVIQLAMSNAHGTVHSIKLPEQYVDLLKTNTAVDLLKIFYDVPPTFTFRHLHLHLHLYPANTD